MLSLSPRYDLFRFTFPKNVLPEEVYNKYEKILNQSPGVVSSPIEYLNESIAGISFPGIQDITVTQEQHGTNAIHPTSRRLNVEPKHEIIYSTSGNPLESINKEFKVTFRLNQNLYNYFMIYETIFYQICKPQDNGPIDVLYIDILGELGVPVSRVTFKDVYIDGIDGLDFVYSKIDRNADTFDVNFKFNNVDFDIIEPDKDTITYA